MNCVFILDSREQQLKDLFKDKDNVTISQLDIGDFIVECNQQVMIVIERKTVNDLVASIVDRRYHEQKHRLLSLRCQSPSTKIIYILEGNFCFDPSVQIRSIKNTTVVSCIINSIIRDNISVVFTKGLLDTFYFLEGLMDRIKSDPQKYFDKKIESCQPFTNIQGMKRKENSNVFIQQLASIPGISAKKAENIVNHYGVKNMKDLCNEISFTSLKTIPGIGSKLASTILYHLRGEKNESLT